jgi:hypothetical protein
MHGLCSDHGAMFSKSFDFGRCTIWMRVNPDQLFAERDSERL